MGLAAAAAAGVVDRAMSDTRGSTMLFSVTATDAVDADVDEVELFLLRVSRDRISRSVTIIKLITSFPRSGKLNTVSRF